VAVPAEVRAAVGHLAPPEIDGGVGAGWRGGDEAEGQLIPGDIARSIKRPYRLVRHWVSL